MRRQYINVDDKWRVLVYYIPSDDRDLEEIADTLVSLGCSEYNLDRMIRLNEDSNTGFTYTNSEAMMSVVCINWAESAEQLFDTAAHELKHVVEAICEYYNVHHRSEAAAYLQGFIGRKMWKAIKGMACPVCRGMGSR